MEQDIKGVVQSATPVKSGTATGQNGQPLNWTLYKVFIDGQEFSAFDKAYAENIGKEVTAKFEIKQNGQYTNYTLKSLNARPNLGAILERIERKVDALLARGGAPMADGSPVPTAEDLPKPDEINIEDIPF